MTTEVWCTECISSFYCENYQKQPCPDCGEEHLLVSRSNFKPHVGLNDFLDRL